MESQRQRKVARLIQKEIGDILQQDKKGIVGNHLVSVMDVKISTDLSVAKIYLSFMMVENKENVFNQINDHKSEIRNLLGKNIGKQVRRVPELIFYKDEVEEQAIRLEEILSKLDIPKNPDEK